MHTDREYPEHEKLRNVQNTSQAIGTFLEWLSGQGIVLAAYHTHNKYCYVGEQESSNPRDIICGDSEDVLYDTHKSIQKLLAEFYDVDLVKLEDEKQQMLEDLRRTQAALNKQPDEARYEKDVHVVAWHYEGGAGFDWYPDPEKANAAYENEKRNADEFAKYQWTAYRFDFKVSVTAPPELITELIDEELDELCAAASIKYPPNRGETRV